LKWRSDRCGGVVGAESVVTEDLDAAIVEIKANVVSNFSEPLSTEQFDGIRVVIFPKPISIFLGRCRESPGGDDHPPLWAVEIERCNRRVKFLDDWSTNSVGVFAFDDDCSTSPVDDFFHDDVSAFVSCSRGLADILVAEVPEYVLNYVFKFEPREIVQDCHFSSIC
jgi:hypothetical protein